jgi:hypothetical protein
MKLKIASLTMNNHAERGYHIVSMAHNDSKPINAIAKTSPLRISSYPDRASRAINSNGVACIFHAIPSQFSHSYHDDRFERLSTTCMRWELSQITLTNLRIRSRTIRDIIVINLTVAACHDGEVWSIFSGDSIRASHIFVSSVQFRWMIKW